ncbi:MAG TPA: glycosyltransferase family 4 protein [Candidatus Polarisedimenticolaceae bacterium]|nr:glycosyltransferase family 4 protein [Candidatus Polarisedimenticolaceae bacterium]
MRVLFFSHYFPPEGNAPASRTYENCRRWVEDGHRVTVVTCAPNHPSGVLYPGYDNRWREREQVDGIEVVRVKTYLAANQGTVRRILNYLSYLASAVLASLDAERPDVIVATSPQFFCGWAGVLAARLHRSPLVLEIRDIWPESITAVGAMRSRPLLRVLEWLELRMYDAATQIVTVGDGYRRCLLEKGVAGTRISVVMNGIDRRLFSPREPDRRLIERLGLVGRFVVSYSGTIGMACGLEVVLDAAAELNARGRREVVFLLVGDGARRESLEREAARRQLDNVRFTGRLDKSQMPAVLALSDVCLVHLRRTPLFETVMPSKIFEALGMRRPVIVGVAGDATRLVERAGAGIPIVPDDAGQLVEAVERLARDAALRERLGRDGERYVITHHDRDALARDYLDLLARVAAMHGPGASRRGSTG